MVALAREVGADIVVIGSEVPLVLVDAVRAGRHRAFGPCGRGSHEGSKAFKDASWRRPVQFANSGIK